jgi:hypothetical protein
MFSSSLPAFVISFMLLPLALSLVASLWKKYSFVGAIIWFVLPTVLLFFSWFVVSFLNYSDTWLYACNKDNIIKVLWCIGGGLLLAAAAPLATYRKRSATKDASLSLRL